jgi:hypothetical protein
MNARQTGSGNASPFSISFLALDTDRISAAVLLHRPDFVFACRSGKANAASMRRYFLVGLWGADAVSQLS